MPYDPSLDFVKQQHNTLLTSNDEDEKKRAMDGIQATINYWNWKDKQRAERVKEREQHEEQIAKEMCIALMIPFVVFFITIIVAGIILCLR